MSAKEHTILQEVKRKITCVLALLTLPALSTSPAYSWPNRHFLLPGPCSTFLQQPLPTSLLESQPHLPAGPRPQRAEGRSLFRDALLTEDSPWPNSSHIPLNTKALGFGLLCLPFNFPHLAKFLLSELRQNPSPWISDHSQYLIKCPHHTPSSRWYLITLAAFSIPV